MKLRDICRLLLGGALFAASLIKVSLPEQFARVVASYGMVPEPLVLPISMGLPFVEVILGSLLAGMLFPEEAAAAEPAPEEEMDAAPEEMFEEEF